MDFRSHCADPLRAFQQRRSNLSSSGPKDPISGTNVGSPLPLAVDLLTRRFEELDTALDPASHALWCHMKPVDGSSFTQGVLRDLTTLREDIHRAFATCAQHEAPPFLYFIMGSRVPGVYNLGGELAYFASLIRSGSRDALRQYAYSCIELTWQTWRRFGTPVVTIALVQGAALGGGFEAALSFDVIIAEESARFGMPEILFNLFPGMGAPSFLTRRLDAARARAMIMSGRIMTAAELRDLGVVDLVCPDGEGEAATRDYIAANWRRHGSHRAIYDAFRRVAPLDFAELRDVVDIWVDTAMTLSEVDLRRMEKLSGAQRRRFTEKTPAAQTEMV